MASSDQSRAPPTPLSAELLVASFKAIQEKESARQLEIDRLKQEIDVLRLKASVQHDWDVNIMDQRVRHHKELESLTQGFRLIAQGVKSIKERESLRKLEMNTLKHDLDASNEKLKMALTELQEQKRIVVEGENLQEDRWEDSAFGHEEFAAGSSSAVNYAH